MSRRIGVIGLGNMGSGLARNLIGAGFETTGFDLSADRMQAFRELGGIAADDAAGTGRGADAVFVMVMNGRQARSVIFDLDGLVATMRPAATIILTATITASEVREIWKELAPTGIRLIDAPVSGGFPGAQSGTLTMMVATDDATLADNRQVLDAVGQTIHHVGAEPGMGQTVKACLQSLIGSIMTATFEASVLAARAGVDADALHKVFSTSNAACVSGITALENIIAGKFSETGSHISTMYKDMTIAMDLAREQGVPLFTAAAAMQLFQAGITRHPDGDNWIVTRITEEIVGAGLRSRED